MVAVHGADGHGFDSSSLPGFSIFNRIYSKSVTYFISFSGHYALFGKICLIQKHLLVFFHERRPPCTQYWFLAHGRRLVNAYVSSICSKSTIWQEPWKYVKWNYPINVCMSSNFIAGHVKHYKVVYYLLQEITRQRCGWNYHTTRSMLWASTGAFIPQQPRRHSPTSPFPLPSLFPLP